MGVRKSESKSECVRLGHRQMLKRTLTQTMWASVV